MATGRLESRTEDLFMGKLREKGYYDDPDITVDRQTCSKEEINRLFEHASKNGTGRQGYPDFIITSNKCNDTVIVVECKQRSNSAAVKEVEHYANYTCGGGVQHCCNSSQWY